MSGQRHCEWMFGRALLAALLLGWSSLRAVEIPAAAEPDALSAANLAQLRYIATRHPCTALALFQLLHDRAGIQDAGMFLTFIPTTQTVVQAFENLDEQKAGELSMLLRQNFYVQAEPVVYITWSVALPTRKDASSDQQVVTFHAELVKDGAPIEPRHLIETDATVVLNSQAIRLLNASSPQAQFSL